MQPNFATILQPLKPLIFKALSLLRTIGNKVTKFWNEIRKGFGEASETTWSALGGLSEKVTVTTCGRILQRKSRAAITCNPANETDNIMRIDESYHN